MKNLIKITAIVLSLVLVFTTFAFSLTSFAESTATSSSSSASDRQPPSGGGTPPEKPSGDDGGTPPEKPSGESEYTVTVTGSYSTAVDTSKAVSQSSDLIDRTGFDDYYGTETSSLFTTNSNNSDTTTDNNEDNTSEDNSDSLKYNKGDVNLDGKIEAKDARLALRASARLETLTEEQLKLADIDGDGKVEASDARRILRYSAKLDSSLD